MAGVEGLRWDEVVSFGPFRLAATSRSLSRAGQPVAIGSRALDILIALVDRAGEVVSRRQLIDRVWPDLVVGEANLRVHVANLRKILNEGRDGLRYVTNIPGRGYCFVAPVERSRTAEFSAIAAASIDRPAADSLPPRLVRMIGRDETVAELCQMLRERRFVSVVGPGGMGKTTVAIAVAHRLRDEFNQTVCFVDLGTLAAGAGLDLVVASSLGCAPQTDDSLPGLLAFVARHRMLLVLDNCEHVIEAAAAFAERLFVDAPDLTILATSREPLRAEGEYLYLLRPLEAPPPNPDITAAEALTWPAIQLFVERAAASGYRLDMTDDDAPVAVTMCRQLDGIALAIELAAGRVGLHGIQGTADLLNNRFRLLWQGRRSALPRHQTMQAMLDWSYNLLCDWERLVLRQLSIFAGRFTLDAAQDVVSLSSIEAMDVAGALSSLADKSLIRTSVVDGTTYHQLLHVTRSHALMKLAQSGEEREVSRRHAQHCCTRLAAVGGATALFDRKDAPGPLPHIATIQAALDWGFSGQGDAETGVELAVLSAPLFVRLSLLRDCRRWCELALAALLESDRGTAKELALQEALAISAMFTRGNTLQTRTALERGLVLANALGSRGHQLHLLAGMHMFMIWSGDFHAAVAVAEQSIVVAGSVDHPDASTMTNWMMGAACHLSGNQERALRHCEAGMGRVCSGSAQTDLFGYDHYVRNLAALARVQWLRGLPREAAEMAQRAIEEAETRNHPVTLCIALAYTATVAIWSRDHAIAGDRIERLVAHAAKHSLAPYHAVGLALRGELAIEAQSTASGILLLREALKELHIDQHHALLTGFLRALAEGLATSGRTAEAMTMIDDAIKHMETTGETCDLPPLLRARGEIHLLASPPDLARAEAALQQSMACARTQSAPGWEFRSALLLARMWLAEGRRDDAVDLLRTVRAKLVDLPGLTHSEASLLLEAGC